MSEDPAPFPANDNARPCPVCGKRPVDRYRPFCSARCADVDLGRWLAGAYAIPAEEEDEGLPERGEER
ncbi:MAG TPA: DNA gyrase inhibitor YacG [Beijerinckiaceae bacterium]|nr:DNA gyrase inhibitor YacG [Beijerinckiaceae bacterium]